MENVPTVNVFDLAGQLDQIRNAEERQRMVDLILTAMRSGGATDADLAKAQDVLRQP